MSTPTLKYIDGLYTTPRRISRTPREYPFGGNGDVTTAMFTATYLIDQAHFTPTPRGTVDPETAGFYLIAETKPEIFQGDLATFVRTYSMIPLQQIVPGSQFIPRPDIPGTFPQSFGQYHIAKPIPTVSSFDAYLPQLVTADSGLSINATGGTYTITFGANTTSALAYNATSAAVQTALNALASVTAYGGVIVSGTYNTAFVITFNSYGSATVNAASLTGHSVGATITNVSIDNSGFRQFVSIQRIATTVTPAWAANTASLTKPTGSVLSSRFFSGSGGAAGATGFGVIEFASTDAATPSISTAGLSVTGGNTFLSGYFPAFPSNLQLQLTIAAQSTFTGQPAYSGSFTLTAYGQTSAPISINGIADGDNAAAAAAILAGLAGMTNLAARGTISVTVSEFTKRFGGAGPSTLFIGAIVRIAPQISGGSYTLTLLGQTTAAIAYNATFADIATALNTLSNVQAYGGITITDTVGGSAFTGDNIQFAYAFQDSSSPSFTGGTYTLTLFTQTTAAIAVSANVSAIQAALNALGNVSAHGGCVVSGAGWDGAGNISFTITFGAALMTGAAGSLTPSPCVINVTQSDGFGRVQNLVISTLNTSRFLVVPSHGFAVGDVLMFAFAGPYYKYGFAWSLVDANTIKVDAAADPFNVSTLIQFVGKRTIVGYKPGTAPTRTKKVTDFYLPGVTAGITTGDDIPLPVAENDSSALLAAIFSGKTSINYEVGDLSQYKESPILMRTVTTINAARI